MVFTQLLYTFVDDFKNQVSPEEDGFYFLICQVFFDTVPDNLKIQGFQFFDKSAGKLFHDLRAFFMFLGVDEILREFIGCPERTGVVGKKNPPVLRYENIPRVPVFIADQVVKSPS